MPNPIAVLIAMLETILIAVLSAMLKANLLAVVSAMLEAVQRGAYYNA